MAHSLFSDIERLQSYKCDRRLIFDEISVRQYIQCTVSDRISIQNVMNPALLRNNFLVYWSMRGERLVLGLRVWYEQK